MSRHDDLLYVKHILDAAAKICDYTRGMTQETFIADSKTCDAVIRQIEIIGEAAKHLSKEFKQKYSTVPWRDVAGMRDVLIHHYFGVDHSLVWSTVQYNIPRLVQDITPALSGQ